ncbi:S-adenosyl-L-methionine-dependent methyltransferase [Absidia repens]|uniref:S-adenosyl-L-methionine-dependent methyltransferase n=1 Tax=Absidia repens TaxID=90262 RepID=A0A1X2IK32_9FUNG|nr:S-adenosyl-L-methionine-dependent methyltransferase [Absidia repens]
MNEGDGVVGRMKTQIFRMLGRPTGQCHHHHIVHKKTNQHSPTTPTPPSPEKKHRRPSSADNICIDGRRYNNYNRIYSLPNDDIEIDRLLNNHFLVKHSFGSNYSAPVTELLSSNTSKNCALSGFRSGTTSPPLQSCISNNASPTSRSACGDDGLKHCSSSDSLVSNTMGAPLTTCKTDPSSHSTTSLTGYFRKLTTLGHRHRDMSHHSLLSSIQQTSTDSPAAVTPTATTTRTTTRTASPEISLTKSPTASSPSSPPPPSSLLPKSRTPTRTSTCPDETQLISSTLDQRRSYSESDLLQCQHQQHYNTCEPRLESCLIYPNTNVTRVLDVACGSGVWILEMAHEFPNTEFYGFDLSEMYPTTIRPKNTFFCLFDMSHGFPYPDEYFDFIRMHDVHTCFPSADTEFIMREIRRCLKKGGYTELREMDFIIYDPGPTTAMFTSKDSLTATKLQKYYDVDIQWPRMIRKYLTMIKLVDVHSRVVPLVYCNHSQQNTSIDEMCYRYWNDRFDAYRRLFWQIFGGGDDIKTHHQLDQYIQQMMKEMLDRSSYCQYYMAWGRKPLVDENSDANATTTTLTTTTDDDDDPDAVVAAAANTMPHNTQTEDERHLKLINHKMDVNGKKVARPNVLRMTSDTYGHEISEFTDGFTD